MILPKHLRSIRVYVCVCFGNSQTEVEKNCLTFAFCEIEWKLPFRCAAENKSDMREKVQINVKW